MVCTVGKAMLNKPINKQLIIVYIVYLTFICSDTAGADVTLSAL
jgi:hypothetical protein